MLIIVEARGDFGFLVDPVLRPTRPSTMRRGKKRTLPRTTMMRLTLRASLKITGTWAIVDTSRSTKTKGGDSKLESSSVSGLSK